MFKPILEGAITTHREASYAARSPVLDCAKAPIHVGNQFADKVRLIFVCCRSGAVRAPAIVSFRRDDNKIIVRCVLGQVSALYPIVVSSEQTVQKVEHGIPLVGFSITNG